MCDGGIMDRSAALSDTHNLAAIHGFIGYKSEDESFEELYNNYWMLCYYVYWYPTDVVWPDPEETIRDGHDFGAEYSDLLDSTFKHGSAKQIRQAVNCIVDLFVGRKSTAEILADFPYLPAP